jgi:hypothetical protein
LVTRRQTKGKARVEVTSSKDTTLNMIFSV